MDFTIPNEKWQEIEALISSDESPVGIDAKKTHIIIIHKLLELERRLNKIEEQLVRK